MTAIAAETPEDRQPVLALNRAAFAGDDEARLIKQLTADGEVVLSLVARDGERVVGHILFSRLEVSVDSRHVPAVSLAPMAVLPANQRKGIGSQLVKRGLELVAETGAEAVVVVGHLAFYRRFGFSSELAAKLASPFQGNEHFMALELKIGALAGSGGAVRYPPAFGI